MDGSLIDGLTWAAAVGSGLVAGVFFAFSSFVMAALGRLPAPRGIAAMRSINVAVINPAFLSAFFGTAAACLALALLSLLDPGRPGAGLRITGGLLYLLGTVMVTVAFNVPLNDALAAGEPEAPEATALWARYLRVWTAWNTVRTAAALAASAVLALALRLSAHPV